jgi:hypothetical protein
MSVNIKYQNRHIPTSSQGANIMSTPEDDDTNIDPIIQTGNSEFDFNSSSLPVFNDKSRNRAANTHINPEILAPLARHKTNTQQNPISREDLDASDPLHQEIEDPIYDSIVQTEEAELARQHITTQPTREEEGSAGLKPFSSPSRVLPSTIAGPLRSIQYNAVRDRTTLIEQLTRTIPLNEYGLPLYLYRPDMLDPSDFQQIPTAQEAAELQQKLGVAIENISYVQGFPAFKTGMPVWAMLPWEDLTSYNVFMEYLEQSGVRSLHLLAGVSLEETMPLLSMNYWPVRAKAFDIYRAAHSQRKRMSRILNTEDNHFEIAGAMLAKINKRIDSFSADEMDALEPKAAADILEKLVRVQRISIGLQAAGGADDKGTNRQVTSVEVSMKRLASGEGSEQQRRDDTDIDLLRDAPESIELAQELLLKVSMGRGNE